MILVLYFEFEVISTTGLRVRGFLSKCVLFDSFTSLEIDVNQQLDILKFLGLTAQRL